MQQLTQKLRSGEMAVLPLPMPVCSQGFVLVRNHYSLISAGTEASTVKTARASLLDKARERPQQVRQVLEVLRTQGPVQTYRAVMKKLDAYSPLGYSSAGTVIEVGSGVVGIAAGDRVACAGGGYANHAEIVAVPANLCVPLPHDADLKAASYNTLGAIALQGIRRADLRLGETCAVIGLGLIGQLTCLMLRASGVGVIGVDLDPVAVEAARKHCADMALERSSPGIVDSIARFTGGLGVDAVIITAGTSSLEPINFAGEIARKRGTVVVVGAVPTGFDREPYYYRKELDLRMSCSYGPGRYDLNYEEKGQDYPAAYVRWTENRNMQAFQALLQSGKISLDYLTTHEVPLELAPAAYDMIVNRSESFLGVIIKYDTDKMLLREPTRLSNALPTQRVGLAFIGAGSYAQGNLLPNLPKNDPDIACLGVMSSSGTTSRRVAERFGFEYCTDNEAQILDNVAVNTVFIATRHDTHGSYVLKALRAGKHVFVEKPLALTIGELEAIRGTLQTHSNPPVLMVGFNRRFSPLAARLKQHLGDGPMAMIYRVNAGAIPPDHWIQDSTIGGGRIVGEACHFVDFMAFLCNSLPVTVYASAMTDPNRLHDTLSINVEFQDGSIGTVCYFANGAKTLAKEYIEVFQAGVTGVIDDFRELRIHGKGKPERVRLYSQDKGQAPMLHAFLNGLKAGTGAPIAFEDIYYSSLATLAVERSIVERMPVRISLVVEDGQNEPAEGEGRASA